MPAHLPQLPHPQEIAQDLGLPARDILRGVRRALAGPMRLLEPVGARLPEPLQHMLHDLSETVDRGARGASGAGTAATVGAALQSPLFSGSTDATARFAQVAYFGLTQALRKSGRADLVVSETVAGYCFHTAMAQTAPDAPACDKAAAVALAMLGHHTIGHAPGTGLGLDARDSTDSRVAVIAVMLWLLTERPDAAPDEAALLALCHDVALSQATALHAAGDDPAQLAGLLDTYARMI